MQSVKSSDSSEDEVHSVQGFKTYDHSQKKMILKDDDINFKFEANWSFSEQCSVCTIRFNKMMGISRHHCRVCGSSTCDPCSSNLINKNRTCDLCFCKIKNKNMIKRKMKLLALKDEKIVKLEKIIKEAKGNIDAIDSCMITIEKEMDQKSVKFTKELDSSKDELSKLKKNIILKRENFEKLKSNVSIEQNIRDAKLEQFNDLKSKRLKEIQEKTSLIYELDQKKKELIELGGQLVVLKDSESFAYHITLDPKTKSFVIATDAKSSRYSALSSMKEMEFKKRKVTLYENRSVESSLRGSKKSEKTEKKVGMSFVKNNCLSGGKGEQDYCRVF